MTYSVTIFNKDGKKVGSVEMDSSVFNDEKINDNLIHEAVVAQHANKRVAIAHTKTRGEIRGSGKKLYRQKGTGSWRVGDKKSPLRKKWWVVFGPRSNRNFSKKMNKKMQKSAVAGIMTMKVKADRIMWLDMFDYKEIKTANAVKTLVNLSLENTKTLVVIPEQTDILRKSFSNLPKVKVILAWYLNPADLMAYEKVLLLDSSLEYITKNLTF